MDAREYIIKKLENDINNRLYAVRVFWKSPFGELSERSGYFDNLIEAEIFEQMLADTYSEMQVPFLTSFRGSVVANNHNNRLSELLDTAKVIEGC